MSSPALTIQRFNEFTWRQPDMCQNYILALPERQELDATIVIAMKTTDSQRRTGNQRLLRDISKIAP